MVLVAQFELQRMLALAQRHFGFRLALAEMQVVFVVRDGFARIGKLLVDCADVSGVPIPTLIERFLAVEDWAAASDRLVVIAIVAHPDYIHPKKFGVQVAMHLGLVSDVYLTSAEASAWLASGAPPDLVDYVLRKWV